MQNDREPTCKAMHGKRNQGLKEKGRRLMTGRNDNFLHHFSNAQTSIWKKHNLYGGNKRRLPLCGRNVEMNSETYKSYMLLCN
ncbi:hypothetical protein GDO81_016772 [Engystomops pustulosus]|uniref:Uncharacterized protein n=1 Tax=Engystomops pustulosus TaxID=76066 RepID=A0AAV7A8T9_ENGPU|nr:hypothetical protein GDO81_016772 [Engystomops pustulosus]